MSTIDETLPVAGALIFASDVQQLAISAKADIEALESKTQKWYVGDGSNLTSSLITWMTAAQNTGARVVLIGTFLFDSVLPDITGFTLDIISAKLIGTTKLATRLRVGNKGRLVGGGTGEVHFRAMRRYRIESIQSATPTSGKITVTILQADLDDPDLGAHSFADGNEVYLQNVVLTSGTLNNSSGIDVTTGGTATTVVLTSSAVVDSSVTYPRARLDGQGRSIYPVIYLARTTSSADAACLVSGATDFLISGVKFKWAGSSGIHMANAHKGVVANNVVWETASDSIHSTNECSNNIIRGNKVYRPGDDGIATVSYFKDGGRCSGLRYYDNEVYDQWFNGRGFSIVGGQNIQCIGLQVEDVYGAGILVYSDNAFETYACEDILISGWSIKTAGLSSAPTGWVSFTQGALSISTGTGAQATIRNVEICSGKIMNSRYRAIVAVDGPEVSLHDIDCDETGADGMECQFKDSEIRNVSFNRTQTQALSMINAGGAGRNKYKVKISNVNRGTRRYIQSISASGGTITGVLEPGQSHGFVSTNVARIVGVTSGNTASSGASAEVAKDFALNAQWTLASVTSDTFTITGTGLSDTAHARTISPDQACPQAYMCLASGSASGTDGIALDTDAITDDHIDIEAKFGELLWPMERTIDDAAGVAAANQYKVFAEIDCLTDDSLDGDSILFRHRPSIGTNESTDAAVTPMLPRALKRGNYIRTGMTAPRTDTLPTAAIIVAVLRASGISTGVAYEWRVTNVTASALTLAVNTGVTNSGSLVVAANTEVVYVLSVTNATPGSEAVTITRRFARGGIAA